MRFVLPVLQGMNQNILVVYVLYNIELPYVWHMLI